MLRTAFVLVVALAALQAQAQRTLVLVESSFELRLADTSLPAGAVGDVSFKTCDKCAPTSRVLTPSTQFFVGSQPVTAANFMTAADRDPQGGEHQAPLDDRAARRPQDSKRESRGARARVTGKRMNPITQTLRLGWRRRSVGARNHAPGVGRRHRAFRRREAGPTRRSRTSCSSSTTRAAWAIWSAPSPTTIRSKPTAGGCGNGQVYYSTTGSAPDCSSPNWFNKSALVCKAGLGRDRCHGHLRPGHSRAIRRQQQHRQNLGEARQHAEGPTRRVQGRLRRARRRQPHRERLSDQRREQRQRRVELRPRTTRTRSPGTTPPARRRPIRSTTATI